MKEELGQVCLPERTPDCVAGEQLSGGVYE